MRELCVFDRILKGELPSNKYLENEDFLAFEDINPKARIHALIIPKHFYKNFNELEPACMAKMTSFIQDLAVFLGVQKSGYKLVCNCIKDQEVPYLHFHLLAD